jgi:hypothetical protein
MRHRAHQYPVLQKGNSGGQIRRTVLSLERPDSGGGDNSGWK